MGAPTDALSDEILDAMRQRSLVESPCVRYPQLDGPSAYAVQDAVVSGLTGAGLAVAGYKVGLTNASARAAAGAEEPVFGRITVDRVFGRDAQVPATILRAARCEPEIAVVVDRAIDTSVDLERLGDHVRGICPAFEIIDSRVTGWASTAVDLIVDNGATSGAVLDLENLHPVEALDYGSTTCTLTRNGVTASTTRGESVGGGPMTSLRWLALALAARGQQIEPGQFVLTGTWATPVAVFPGDEVRADFGSLGDVRVSIADR